MKPVLGVCHVAREGLGTLENFLTARKQPVEICRSYRGDAVPRDSSLYSALIIMGGDMNVDETEKYPFLHDEVNLIKDALYQSVPILGICLGAQLIAKALDARVYPGELKEMGWYSVCVTDAGVRDPLMQALFPDEEGVVFHWHGDTFDLPSQSVRLASSAIYPNQAFRYGQAVYGLQFHIEMTKPMVDEWVMAGEAEIKSAASEQSARIIISRAQEHLPKLAASAERFYREFFSHVQTSSARN